MLRSDAYGTDALASGLAARNCACDDVITEASGLATTLEYAVNWLPVESALQLIQEGRMPLDGVCLTYAIMPDQVPLVRALLDAGADVNARVWRGCTALHWFSHLVRLGHLKAMVECAEDKVVGMRGLRKERQRCRSQRRVATCAHEAHKRSMECLRSYAHGSPTTRMLKKRTCR